MECITEEFATILIEIVVLPIYKDTLTFDLFPSTIKVELDTINGLPTSNYFAMLLEVVPENVL